MRAFSCASSIDCRVLSACRTRVLIEHNVQYKRTYSVEPAQAAESFIAGDTVHLREFHLPKWQVEDPKVLQLKQDTVYTTHKGQIAHNDIIGKTSHDIIHSHNGAKFSVVQPSLEDYILHLSRIATPIYPKYAALIVFKRTFGLEILTPQTHLLNLDPSPSQVCNVLECGTGAGGLSLYLARAIQGYHVDSKVYSVEAAEKHLKAARKAIGGYRRGLYASSVNLQGPMTLSEWIESAPSDLLFDGAVLDMPESHKAIQGVTDRLKRSNNLAIFCPSVTQILTCIEYTKHADLPLLLVDTWELSNSLMREWDIRSVNVRATDEPAVVCRPRVGGRARGGGFVCLFQKTH